MVLPGVTGRRPASDVLIERVRSVITESAGVYTIIDLRPGTYDAYLPPRRVQQAPARRHRADAFLSLCRLK